MRSHRARHQKCALQIYVHRRVPQIFAGFYKRHALGDTRDIHQEVHSTVASYNLCNHSFYLSLAANITNCGLYRRSCARHLAGQHIHLGTVDVRDDNMGALTSQPDGDRPADALRPTHNDRDLAFETFRRNRTELFHGLLLRSEKSDPELCNAGTDSKQFEELTTCNPSGSDSPKVRTASARSGGTHLDRSSIASSPIPVATKREIVFSRISSAMSRARSPVRRAICTMAELVSSVNVDKSSRAFNHWPAISGFTTECSGPYSGMRVPSLPSDHSQIASSGSFLILAISS